MERELELKFRLLDKQVFIEKLRKLGIVLSEEREQNDTIFFRRGKGFADLKDGEPVIRIREENNRVKATLKKYVYGITDREEIECGVSDANLFCDFLIALDCVPVVTVNKTRAKGSYAGATITLDHVDGLGDFTEIEIMSDQEETDSNSRKLKDIIIDLELDMRDLVSIPYDEMLFLKGKEDD